MNPWRQPHVVLTASTIPIALLVCWWVYTRSNKKKSIARERSEGTRDTSENDSKVQDNQSVVMDDDKSKDVCENQENKHDVDEVPAAKSEPRFSSSESESGDIDKSPGEVCQPMSPSVQTMELSENVDCVNGNVCDAMAAVTDSLLGCGDMPSNENNVKQTVELPINPEMGDQSISDTVTEACDVHDIPQSDNVSDDGGDRDQCGNGDACSDDAGGSINSSCSAELKYSSMVMDSGIESIGNANSDSTSAKSEVTCDLHNSDADLIADQPEVSIVEISNEVESNSEYQSAADSDIYSSMSECLSKDSDDGDCDSNVSDDAEDKTINAEHCPSTIISTGAKLYAEHEGVQLSNGCDVVTNGDVLSQHNNAKENMNQPELLPEMAAEEANLSGEEKFDEKSTCVRPAAYSEELFSDVTADVDNCNQNNNNNTPGDTNHVNDKLDTHHKLNNGRCCECSSDEKSDQQENGWNEASETSSNDECRVIRRESARKRSKLRRLPLNLDNVDDDKADLVIEVYVEFPSECVGLLIGKQGRNIKQLKTDSGADVFVHESAFRDDIQILQIKGTQTEIESCVRRIKRRFNDISLPPHDRENIKPPPSKSEVSSPPPPLLYPVSNISQLQLPDGATVDVYVSAIADVDCVFLQQPAHPTFHALANLERAMLACYAEPSTPSLPNPPQVGLICAAHQQGLWYRAQIIQCFDDDTISIRFMDYGGFATLPARSIKQIRADFVTLPFQACECYLDNIAARKDNEFCRESVEKFQGMLKEGSYQARVTGYRVDGYPRIHLYKSLVDKTTLINQDIAEKGLASWVEPAPNHAPCC